LCHAMLARPPDDRASTLAAAGRVPEADGAVDKGGKNGRIISAFALTRGGSDDRSCHEGGRPDERGNTLEYCRRSRFEGRPLAAG
jgi:hypothetical protein